MISKTLRDCAAHAPSWRSVTEQLAQQTRRLPAAEVDELHAVFLRAQAALWSGTAVPEGQWADFAALQQTRLQGHDPVAAGMSQSAMRERPEDTRTRLEPWVMAQLVAGRTMDANPDLRQAAYRLAVSYEASGMSEMAFRTYRLISADALVGHTETEGALAAQLRLSVAKLTKLLEARNHPSAPLSADEKQALVREGRPWKEAALTAIDQAETLGYRVSETDAEWLKLHGAVFT